MILPSRVIPSDTMMGPHHKNKFGRARPLQLLILMIVRNEKKYGYEILKELRDAFGDVWEPQTGTVYPVIKKLQTRGLLDSEIIDDKEYYWLTEKGKEFLSKILPEVGYIVFMAAKFMTIVTKTMDEFGVEASKMEDPHDDTEDEKLSHLKEVRSHMEFELQKINEKINKIEGK